VVSEDAAAALLNGMRTSLYYTFSTIAQTLAAAIGFLAAVVLYQVGRIDAESEDHARGLLELWDKVSADDPRKECRDAWDAWYRRDHDELLRLLAADAERTKRANKDKLAELTRLRSGVKRYHAIRTWGITAVVVTGIAIMAALWVLTRAHRIDIDVGEPLLCAGLAVAGLALASYVVLGVQLQRRG
jgi:hypothetical protein